MPEQATATPPTMAESTQTVAESKRAAETLEDGLRRLALTGIEDALAEVNGAQDDDAAVHALRKQCKRMRALLNLFERGLAGQSRQERRRFRDLARSLSQLRDARVVLDVHADLLERYGTLLDPVVGAEIRQRMIAAMQAEPARMNGTEVRSMDRDLVRAVLLEARSHAEQLGLSTKRRSLVLDALERSYRRARADAGRCAETPDASHLHSWRKRVKALWYQLEFVAELWPGIELPWVAPLSQLSDLLGQAQDCAIYRDAIERSASDRSPLGVELLASLAERQRRTCRRQAIRLGKEILQEKPKHFRARLKAAVAAR